MPETETMRESAAALDARDPLAKYRERFYFPRTPQGEPVVYLVGHSLGLQPKTARAYLEQEMKDWEELGVHAHLQAKSPWVPYHRFLADQTARLVGARSSEVVVMNSLTVNLHLMMVSFFRPTKQRHKIVIERGAFPSDQYAIKSQLRYHGLDPATSLIELTPRAREATLRDEDIRATIDGIGETIALVLLGGVNYSTGQAFDMPGITKAGHAQGCVVAFDLAHAAGNVVLRLHDWDVDFAVWCNYKYVNGGPGCVGGCFVHERHARAFELPRFAGWWGHDEGTRFRMGPDFQPMAGAEGWQISNPPVLSMAALRAALEIFEEAGMEALRLKSVALTRYLESLLEQHQSPRFTVITPSEASRRGAMLAIRILENASKEHANKLVERLAEAGVMTDFREPNILRVTPVPLYNSFTDVAKFVEQFVAGVSS
ncbi:MAG: kynureninase [Acidobacteriota bacterium]|nr:kynureninase [Acidobacteriota bacterium]